MRTVFRRLKALVVNVGKLRHSTMPLLVHTAISLAPAPRDEARRHRLNRFRRDGVRIAEMCTRDIAGRFAGVAADSAMPATVRRRSGTPCDCPLRTYPAGITA